MRTFETVLALPQKLTATVFLISALGGTTDQCQGKLMTFMDWLLCKHQPVAGKTVLFLSATFIS